MKKFWQILMRMRLQCLLIAAFLPISAIADITCKGKFVNPITDICWSCIMPISIGNVINIGSGIAPKKRDSKNPSSPICVCSKANALVPGIALGFWEPVRLIDVTPTPYCLTNLGGVSLGTDMKRMGSFNRSYDGRHVHDSFYHVYFFNLKSWKSG